MALIYDSHLSISEGYKLVLQACNPKYTYWNQWDHLHDQILSDWSAAVKANCSKVTTELSRRKGMKITSKHISCALWGGGGGREKQVLRLQPSPEKTIRKSSCL